MKEVIINLNCFERRSNGQGELAEVLSVSARFIGLTCVHNYYS